MRTLTNLVASSWIADLAIAMDSHPDRELHLADPPMLGYRRVVEISRRAAAQNFD